MLLGLLINFSVVNNVYQLINSTRLYINFIVVILLVGCSNNPEKSYYPKLPILNDPIERTIFDVPKYHQRSRISCTQDYHRSSIHEIYIDVEFLDFDLRDAITEISMIADINILIDDSIDGIVSSRFEDESVAEILNSILSIGNFDYKVFPDFILVASADPAFPVFNKISDTCTYSSAYRSALELIDLLSPQFHRYVRLVEASNMISITAPQAIQKKIQSELILHDQEVDQVVIELTVIEVSKEALSIIGIDFKNMISDTTTITDQQFNQRRSSVSNQGGITLTDINTRHFINAVQFMSESGQAHIKTMPTIIAQNGKPAKFKSMETIYNNSQDGSNQSNNMIGLSFGVELEVVPQITHEDKINLYIKKAQISDLVDAVGDQSVLVNHQISSTVMIEHGMTLLIGGLYQTKRRAKDPGVIGLKNLPLLGRLFRTDVHSSVEMEVLIMIKPLIIRG